METGKISAYTKNTIQEMSEKVLEHLAAKYKHVKEGVKSVMGGKILEYEAKTILNTGREESAFLKSVNGVYNLIMKKNFTKEEAFDMLEVTKEDRDIISELIDKKIKESSIKT